MATRIAIVFIAVAATASAQSFEVASIRPNRSGDRIMLFQPARGGRFTATNCSLSLLIQYAYDVLQYQIYGAPDWVRSERFDLNAKSEGDPPVEAIRAMLQKLLEDRFHLALHREAREAAVYYLAVSKPDRLKPAAAGDCPSILSGAGAGPRPPSDAPCGGLRNTPGHTKGYRLTAGEIAGSLSFFLQRSVLDKTGLTGRYDVELEWTPESKAQNVSSDAPPSIFTAVQEQLGLKLEPAKGAVTILAVDHVDRPSEN